MKKNQDLPQNFRLFVNKKIFIIKQTTNIMKQTLLNYAKIAIIAALLGLSIGVITATFQISFEFGLFGFAVFIAYRIIETIAQHIADTI